MRPPKFLDSETREMCKHLFHKGLVFSRMALNKNKALFKHELTAGLYVCDRNWPSNDSKHLAISLWKRVFLLTKHAGSWFPEFADRPAKWKKNTFLAYHGSLSVGQKNDLAWNQGDLSASHNYSWDQPLPKWFWGARETDWWTDGSLEFLCKTNDLR